MMTLLLATVTSLESRTEGKKKKCPNSTKTIDNQYHKINLSSKSLAFVKKAVNYLVDL